MKAIITADWHLRADKPRCRLDENWFVTQQHVLSFISEETKNRGVPLFVVGDIFNTPNVPSSIVNIALDCLLDILSTTAVGILAGNHDLPYHSWANVNNSSFGILNRLFDDMGSYGQWAHFGEAFDGAEEDKIRFIHALTFPDLDSIPSNAEAFTAPELLSEYPDNWIFTGDYHHSFHYEKNGRHVINPGCILRQVADMIEYQPKICYVDTEAEIVEWINIPDNEAMVTDEYLRDAEEREDRISAFIEGVNQSGQVSLNFLDNLEAAMADNKMNKLVKDTILELVEKGEEK